MYHVYDQLFGRRYFLETPSDLPVSNGSTVVEYENAQKTEHLSETVIQQGGEYTTNANSF